MKILGDNLFMCKIDIVDVFKLLFLLVFVEFYYGIKWRDKYYFYKRLVFGCRSSLKIFDMFF